jgi:hypothetical protein
MKRRISLSAMHMVWTASLLAGAPTSVSGQALTDVLVWEADLRLSETPEALVVDPDLRRMPGGGWLYWDRDETQIRIYDANGTLRTAFGRKGEGPGEFRTLMGADVLPDGRVVALDARGKLSLWNPRGTLELEFQSGVDSPVGVASASATTVIVSARGAPNTQLLHVVDLGTRARTSSFFSPTTPANAFTPYATVVHPPIVVVGGRVYRAVPPSDSIWSVGIASPHASSSFRVASTRLARNTPPLSIATGPAAARAWINASSYVGTFGRTSDGGWIVQVWGFIEGKPSLSLVRLGGDGRRVWEVENTPKLLAVDGDRLYLWDPEGLEPNRIKVGRLK